VTLVPVSRDVAFDFIDRFHRHHPSPTGWKFGIALMNGDELVGVVTVGRPTSRMLARDPFTAEVTRLCTDGTRNACSKLYAAAWRACAAMGYRRLVTYILESEPGTSLVATGFRFVRLTRAESWDRPSRPRRNRHPTVRKKLFEKRIHPL
jgi:hypothetical protein